MADTLGVDVRISPPSTPLGDGVVRLRPLRSSDASAIVEACQDPEIGRWIPLIPVPYTVVDARRYIDASLQAWRDGTELVFAIADPADDRLLGSIGLQLATPRRPAVGYWLAPEARGRGLATRALRLVARWAFERLSIERLSLWTLPGNLASQAVAERAGFRYEGVLRNWDRGRQGPQDAVMFGLTAADALPQASPDGGTGPGQARPDERQPATPPPGLLAPGSRDGRWESLLALADLPPAGMRRVSRRELDLLVADTPAGIVVTDDRCPHMAAPLSIGDLDGCAVGCPLHAGRFDLCTGSTLQMPTTGGLDAEGIYHSPWSPSGSTPKPEPASSKLEARRLTRVRRLRFYPARIAAGRLEARLPRDAE